MRLVNLLGIKRERKREREGNRERVVRGGGSKVAVLTQIKQHLVRVLTLSLSLFLSQFATTQTMGM